MKSLGQIAYEAWQEKSCKVKGYSERYRWELLVDDEKVIWEEVALAVSDELYQREREV